MKTINYAKKLNTTFAQFSVWTPYPGTPVFKEYEDRITAQNYEEFDQYNLVFKHNVLSAEKIRFLLGKTYTMYYGRLSWFLKFLKNSIFA
jgi:anaerobic magnesium-protoporphyrin IX monomethyl ester cyclase